ncbi:MAG TPA: hypothetical protein VIF57_30590 [Polyangia bacterium]|jgi:hypothetical protein
MKRVSLIAVGLLAYGLTAARAEVGATAEPAAPDTTETTVTPPPGVDASGNPLPPGDAQVGVNPPATPPAPPTAGAPGSVQTAPAGSAAMPSGADVDVNPPAALPRPPVPVTPVAAPRPPQRQSIMPPAQVINNNTAAITGGVMEQALPVPQPVQPAPPVQPVGPGFADHGVAHDNAHATTLSRVGAAFLLGGGYEDFTNSNLRSMTAAGGSWNARLLAGTRHFLGVEAAYVGAARGIDALGVGSNAVLLSNGFEGNVRLNLPIVMRRAQLLEPFGFVGVGWSHYQVANTNNVNTSDLANDDDVLNLPVGGGLEYAVGRFMADARFTYRQTYYNDLMRTGGSLSNWGVGGQLGVAF